VRACVFVVTATSYVRWIDADTIGVACGPRSCLAEAGAVADKGGARAGSVRPALVLAGTRISVVTGAARIRWINAGPVGVARGSRSCLAETRIVAGAGRAFASLIDLASVLTSARVSIVTETISICGIGTRAISVAAGSCSCLAKARAVASILRSRAQLICPALVIVSTGISVVAARRPYIGRVYTTGFITGCAAGRLTEARAIAGMTGRCKIVLANIPVHKTAFSIQPLTAFFR